jgi:hypothetical protein
MSNGIDDKMNARNRARSDDREAWRETIKRLPLTLRPMLNQQLENWELLFPFEREEAGRFFRGADSFSPGALNRLTAQLRSLEAKMGVANWHFSEVNNTMEDSAMLARSRYYAEWRAEVQRVYAVIESREPAQDGAQRRSLVLLLIPENLPIDSETAWKLWEGDGQTITLTGDSRQIANLLLAADPRVEKAPASNANDAAAARWLIDADHQLQSRASLPAGYSALSFSALKEFRERFLAELNTIPKDMTAADETMSRLRTANWAHWCPPELARDPRLLHFAIDLFLTGNGALIFPSAFVEWAASEALRRARPQFLAARFGMRSKPKPFTSIAIFENQERVSTIPAVDDPVNSAIDAAVLARYAWLAASRHPEYEKAVCLCVSEHLNAARLIAPPGSGLENCKGAVRAEDLCNAIRAWGKT